MDLSFFPSTEGTHSFEIDLIRFRRLLNLSDVAYVRQHLGTGAAARRWYFQVSWFFREHGELAVAAGRLARERMRENSSPLDRQLLDGAEFLRLWTVIGTLAAIHFTGVPLQQALQGRLERLRELAGVIRPVAVAQPLAAG